MNDLFPYLPSLMVGLGLFLMGMISPGPNILTVIGTAMSQGRKQASALAMGVATGTFLWATLSVTGLSAIVSLYAGAMIAIKLIGAAYLLFLAYKAFRNAASTINPQPVTLQTRSLWPLYLRGLTVQMTNPKAAIQWLAVVAVSIGGNAPVLVGVILIVSATMLSVIGHLVYALAFSTNPVVAAYLRTRRFVQAGLGVFFCFASYKLATAKV